MSFELQQRRTCLLAQCEKEVDTLLQWEAQAEKPDLTDIEEVVLATRQVLANDLIAAQAHHLEADATQPTDPQTGKKLHPKGKKNGSVRPE